MSAGSLPTPRPTNFVSGGHTLDAWVHEPAGEARGAMVVAHPHPAHGGHMDHSVVVTTAERAAAAGLVTLRFDFRGVRRSEGDSQDVLGHVEDAHRALEEVRGTCLAGPLLGGGFSYGARMMVRAVLPGPSEGPSVSALLLLAPAIKVPKSRRDFGNLLLGRELSDAALDDAAIAALGRLSVRTRVLVGERDNVAPPDALHAALSPTAALDVLPGLNHFFSRGRGASATDVPALAEAVDRALRALGP